MGRRTGVERQSRRKQASPLTCVLHISLPSVNLLGLAAKSGEPGVAASLGWLSNRTLSFKPLL